MRTHSKEVILVLDALLFNFEFAIKDLEMNPNFIDVFLLKLIF